MTTPRPHAEMIKKWADDESLQKWRWSPIIKEWRNSGKCWYVGEIYHVGHTEPTAPPKRMCTLGGLKYPAPETVAPPLGAKFWVAGACGKPYELYWQTSTGCLELNAGLFHLNREAAELHSKALRIANMQAIDSAR